MAIIAPNPAMDDKLLEQHQDMLDHVGSDLIHLQNQAYERGWQVGIEQVGGVNTELLEACKDALVWFETNLPDAPVANILREAIAKAEPKA